MSSKLRPPKIKSFVYHPSTDPSKDMKYELDDKGNLVERIRRKYPTKRKYKNDFTSVDFLNQEKLNPISLENEEEEEESKSNVILLPEPITKPKKVQFLTDQIKPPSKKDWTK
jgi:ubiquitin C-terminal hydrolase